jgi:acyl-CoA synthetase (AMP-forming)/AMP-acid ligase II
VELGEIEAVLSAAPGVRGATVVLQDIDTPNAALIAYVEPASVDKEVVLAACGAKLPRYMVPAVVVQLDQLPQLANGKVRSSLCVLHHTIHLPPASMTQNQLISPGGTLSTIGVSHVS